MGYLVFNEIDVTKHLKGNKKDASYLSFVFSRYLNYSHSECDIEYIHYRIIESHCKVYFCMIELEKEVLNEK